VRIAGLPAKTLLERVTMSRPSDDQLLRRGRGRRGCCASCCVARPACVLLSTPRPPAYHAARILPTPSATPHRLFAALSYGRQPTELLSTEPTPASPIRLAARKGLLLVSRASPHDCPIVSSVQLSAPFREHESSHRLPCPPGFPVCFWSLDLHSCAPVFSLVIVRSCLV
jgi:hypothetical protein